MAKICRTLRECASSDSIPWWIVEDYCLYMYGWNMYKTISYDSASIDQILKNIVDSGLVTNYWDGRFAA